MIKINRFVNFINESNSEYMILYHGTHSKFKDSIYENGLNEPTGLYSPGWYMLSSDIESAIYHATPTDGETNVYIFEFKIPIQTDLYPRHWNGYPYLWTEYKRNENSSWYALREPLSKEMINELYEIDIDTWREIKMNGY